MVAALRNLRGRITRSQKGFTLIEMIVVVGIIAVLAVVIIPNVSKFIGNGESGAKAAERESVETALAGLQSGADTPGPSTCERRSPRRARKSGGIRTSGKSSTSMRSRSTCRARCPTTRTPGRPDYDRPWPRIVTRQGISSWSTVGWSTQTYARS